MNRERLQQMVTMLRELPAENFDLSTWHCGTTACAVGHACLSPVFQEQGLSLKPDEFDGRPYPAFGGFYGFDAVEQFFGLSHSEADHLFLGSCYPNLGKDATAAQVADRIDALLATAEVSA